MHFYKVPFKPYQKSSYIYLVGRFQKRIHMQMSISENPIVGQNSAMKHSNLTNKVSLPMISMVRILIKTYLRQWNAGNSVKYEK